MRRPELVAHRGLAAHFPENTLAAYAAAIEAGARWVETDVLLSHDGVPFLFHDRGIERLTGLRGPLHERTELELGSIAAAYPSKFGVRFSRERVAKLADLVTLLGAHPEVRVFVELKRQALDRFGIDMVLERVLATLVPLGDRATLISFSLPALLAARKVTKLTVGAVFDRWSERDDRSVRELAPEFVFCDLEGLPLNGELVHPGARVAIYEVGDGATAKSLAARGVELVETFDVAKLARELA